METRANMHGNVLYETKIDVAQFWWANERENQ